MSRLPAHSVNDGQVSGADVDVQDGISNMRMINLGPSLPINIASSLEAAQQTQVESGRRGYHGYNRFYSHTPRQAPLLPSVCDVCQSISFDLLPSENEAALPHHTWELLNSSAVNCILCRIVRWAVLELRAIFIAEVGAPENGVKYLWNGDFITGHVPEIAPTTRIYIFASWWRKGPSAPNNLLMGLGVRFGIDLGEIGLGPAEADGRQTGGIPIRGTPVRILTDFGMLPITNSLSCNLITRIRGSAQHSRIR
jgi:hypothetical protein